MPSFDAAPYRQVLRELWRTHTLSEIAAVAHVPTTTLHRVINGQERVWTTTAVGIRVAAVTLLPSGVCADRYGDTACILEAGHPERWHDDGEGTAWVVT